jgi:hypothetical protein
VKNEGVWSYVIEKNMVKISILGLGSIFMKTRDLKQFSNYIDENNRDISNIRDLGVGVDFHC